MSEESNLAGGLIKEFEKNGLLYVKPYMLLEQSHARSAWLVIAPGFREDKTSPLQKMKGSPMVKPVSITD